jgi:hypothetical protein
MNRPGVIHPGAIQSSSAREAQPECTRGAADSPSAGSEKTTEVSNSYPHASHDQKLPTHRSLTYLESLTAIEAAWQLGQRWFAFSLIRFTSICYKDIPSHLQKDGGLVPFALIAPETPGLPNETDN